MCVSCYFRCTLRLESSLFTVASLMIRFYVTWHSNTLFSMPCVVYARSRTDFGNFSSALVNNSWRRENWVMLVISSVFLYTCKGSEAMRSWRSSSSVSLQSSWIEKCVIVRALFFVDILSFGITEVNPCATYVKFCDLKYLSLWQRSWCVQWECVAYIALMYAFSRCVP